MLFTPQLPLQLEPRRENRFEQFIAGPNQAVVDALQALAGQQDASLFLQGAESSGKTHLLNAVCHAVRTAGRQAFYLGLGRLPPGATASLEGLEVMDVVCVDDLHLVAGDAAWDEALFHFINRLRAKRGSLVIASRQRLGSLPLQLPDLASRLAWGLRMELSPLSEADKIQVLESFAASLGVDLPEDVVQYLIRHDRRSLARLLNSVDQLRLAAISAKRRITVPLARAVIEGG